MIVDLLKPPAAAVYGGIGAVRNWLYDHGVLPVHAPKQPVVSVGNITAGGNAKTPLAYLAAKMLGQAGYRPVILSRGYGGAAKGPLLVQAASSFSEVGDEPLMLARRGAFPVVIARSRRQGHDYIVGKQLGNAIVLDDAFQHRALGRDLDIVSINASSQHAIKRFLSGGILPQGFFREPREPALDRAGAFVLLVQAKAASLIEGGKVPDEINAILRFLPKDKPKFFAHYELDAPRPLLKGDVWDDAQPTVAFCGLAQPEGFFTALQESGIALMDQVSFRDHHRYCRRDIDGLRSRFGQINFMCSEKDAVKLDAAAMDLRCVFEVRADLTILQRGDFDILLRETCKRHEHRQGN